MWESAGCRGRERERKLRAKQHLSAASAALTERKKGQDKESSQEQNKKKKTADMKEARKQARETLTKNGKAWSQDLCPIIETETK